ncbi:LacI family DNA-binding transcriptional regulator [uncultured Amnibacterium sp.]|uniref:LacI family DNA-binding transcriptional regulator n=1 Tax=uncultured Amnibacterium sp. TaxID=1631851 RepID=UPI0035CC5B95
MVERRVTQADVALLAGVSPTAVSLVLNERSGTRLSADAAERVRNAARELGYRPNLTARALSTQRSDAIGLVSDLAVISREANALVKGALQAARELGYTLFVAETDSDPAAEQEAVEALIDRQVDGIVYAVSRAREIVVPEAARRTRLVLLNATSSTEHLSVLPDEYAGGRSVVELLAGAGHTAAIAVIGADEPQEDSDLTVTVRRRLEGMWSAFREHDMDPFVTMATTSWDLAAGHEAMRRLLASGHVPQAIICLNDRLAFGACRALGEAGLVVPDDVSVVSFDDDIVAQFMQPQLTTAALPYAVMGELAVNLLMDADAEHREYLVPMPMRIRGSVAFRA